MKFLTARWSNLFLATYTVPPELLTKRLPPGLELDFWDSHCFVSLVAFDFLDTKVGGIPWPGFRNFPEINLRFYVRHGGRRGVVFVREFVPQAFVAWMARLRYNEPYEATSMSSAVHDAPDRISVVHRLEYGGRLHTINATGSKPAVRPDASSIEHFFKEHEWGFGVSKSGRALAYRVEHPVWDIYPVADWSVDLDWAAVYGPEWATLQDAAPVSLILAAGSPVSVYSGAFLEHGADGPRSR